MRGSLVALLVCTTVAHAAPQQVLVLRAEGTAAVATKTNVETQVLRLAKHIDGKVDAGDITLTDAAAAAGCNAADAACKDEILMTFGVDEVVATTVQSSGGQHIVMVRRLRKGTPAKTASSRVVAGAAFDTKLDADLGPLFGIAASSTAATAPSPPERPLQPTTPTAAPPPTPTTQPLPGPEMTASDGLQPTPSGDSSSAAVTSVPAPTSQSDAAPVDRSKQKVGLVAGGALVVLSVVLWSTAASTQSDIDNAPTSTPADFAALRALESEADGQAGLGNLFFVAGVVVGGISGYYYWKKGRQARTQTARVTPTVFPNGAGIVLSFGGAR